jgi:hypothetical protein
LIENVLEAYNFLANNYRAGDQLFFFGFSRGAYTVRAAAGLVCHLGVLKPAAVPAFMQHYNEYIHTKDDPPKPFEEYQPWVDFLGEKKDYFIANKNEVKIQVIGVWETVGSLGVPDLGHWIKWYKSDRKPYQFHDTNLNNRMSPSPSPSHPHLPPIISLLTQESSMPTKPSASTNDASLSPPQSGNLNRVPQPNSCNAGSPDHTLTSVAAAHEIVDLTPLGIKSNSLL